jgi:hypothetical protein
MKTNSEIKRLEVRDSKIPEGELDRFTYELENRLDDPAWCSARRINLNKFNPASAIRELPVELYGFGRM